MSNRQQAFWTPKRSEEPEQMDQPGLEPELVREAHQVLRTVNRQFFGAGWVLRRELRSWTKEEKLPQALTLLDLGAGSGDLMLEANQMLKKLGHSPHALAVDRDPIPLAMARQDRLFALQADALQLPLPDRCCDLVCAIKFAHHFSGPALVKLLAEMGRVSRSRVLVLDIKRDWLAYAGFVAWSRVFTRTPLVRFDGPLSVRRGFLPKELLEAARHVEEFEWSVRRYAGFQLALVGRRQTQREQNR